MHQADLSLIVHVATALAGGDAEASWSAAIQILGEAGAPSLPPAEAGSSALLLEHGDQRAAFATGALEPEALAALAPLLRAGWLRALQSQQLRRAQERLELLSSASFEGIFAHESGNVIDANRRCAEMLRYEPGEMLGPDTLARCVAPEDLPIVRRHMAEQYQGAYVISCIRKDGSRFRAELQAKQGQLGERPVRVVAVRDVTARERTGALLRESEAQLRELALQTFDFIVFSRNGIVLDVQGSLERVLGIYGVEMVGHALVEFVAPSAVPQVTQLLAQQRTGTYESSLVSASGEYVPVEITAVMITLEGEPVRMGGVRDLRSARQLDRDRRLLEEQLQRSQRLESLGVLAGGIAHDFNNLLVGVLGNAELLQDSLRDPEERKLCDALIVAAQRAADLTAQLLAYAGRRDLGARQTIDLEGLWRELSAALSARLVPTAVLQLRLEHGCAVQGDRAGLTQVLMNLLTNASDALEDRPGVIEVSTRRVQEPDARWDQALGAPVGPGDWVLTEVRDSGVGMDGATLSRVFEPFFTTKEKGHGLGLASCLGIVSSHGGALCVESEPGAGSRFSVLLPAAPRSGTVAPPPQPRRPRRAPRILVIDDELVVRSLLRRSLERRGYQVTDAAGGQAGLRALTAEPPDLVVLDISMPEVDGPEVLRRLRQQGLTLPVLITSGNVEPALERRLEPGSFQGFLRKPFSIAELMAAIEGLLPGPS
jgi:PAS domain S-box-containing protein